MSNNSIYAQDCCCGTLTEIDVPGGDFETSPFPSPGGWIDYSAGETLGPWGVAFGSVSHHDDGHNNLGAGNPNPSSAHADLHGFSEGGICQDISGFTIGQEYQLIFYYAIHNAAGSADGLVEIDGGAALSESWSASNQGQDNWLEAVYSFTATSETMELCFSGGGAPPCCGMLIDDIEISFTCNGDLEFPELFNIPTDENYQCIDDVPAPPFINGTDNCITNVNVFFNEEIDDSNLCAIIITRTWTAEDQCGNLTEEEQIIFVSDTEAPEIIMPPFDLNIGCNEDVNDLLFDWIDLYGGADLIDNCGDIFNETNYFVIDLIGCFNTEVVFTFSDFCGNEILAIAEINVVDVVPPNFDVLPEALNIPCGDNASDLIDDWLIQDGFAEVSDLCNLEITNDFNDNYGVSQSITFTATDLCGLQSTAVADIFLNDTQVEVTVENFTCNPDDAGQETFLIDNPFCDTLVTLNTLLLPSDTTVIELNTCNQIEAGSDTIFLSNIYSCDSLVISNLTFVDSEMTLTTATTCNSLEAGLDTLFLLNANNCDSLIITNTVLIAGDTTYNSLTTCDIGQIGADTFYFVNSNNCDSLVVFNTFFASADTSYMDMATCDFYQAGLDTINLIGIENCDSIVIINSVYIPRDTTFNVVPTCEISQVGVDTSFLLNANGCDSLIVTTFLFTENDTIVISEFVCEEMESITTTVSGLVCDTILIREFIALQSDSINIEVATCQLAEVQTSTEELFNVDGCDSVVVTNYYYEPLDTVIIQSETCFLNELLQDTVDIIGSHCDSVVIYSTTLLQGNETFIEQFVCDNLQAGSDTLFLQNQTGCDSLVITENIYNDINFEVAIDFDPCEESALATIDIVNFISTLPVAFSIDGENFINQGSFSGLSPGDYSLYAQDVNGCIFGPVNTTFEPNTEFIELESLSLLLIGASGSAQINLEFSQDPDSFYWSNEALLSCIDCFDPIITAVDNQELILYYQDAAGCQYSRTIDILVEDIISDIYIPNVFTPGHHSSNNFFQIYNIDTSVNLESCSIYDRWGNRVYSLISNDIAGIKWDGTRKGIELMSGVYVYHIIIKDQNGDLEHLVGSVSLLR